MQRYHRASKMLLPVWLCAAVSAVPAAAYAAEYPLFPRNNASQSTVAEAPKELPPVAAPAPGQPLRVVIPNIKQENNSEAGAESTEPSTAQSIYQGAQEMWNNGLLAVNWRDIPIIRTILKPDVEFVAVPQQWNVAAQTAPGRNTIVMAQNAQAMAALAPAAGGEPATLVPLTQSAAPSPIAPVTPTAPVPPSSADTSEPAPTLSSQSKTIAEKVPTVSDKPAEKPFKKKVDIDRAREVGDVLNDGNKPTASSEALGIKVDGPRAKFDVNYELERAYNALVAGKSDVAIQIYEDILTGNPRNKDALFGLASTYHRLGQIDMARALYGKLLAIDPKHRDGLNNFLVLLADEAPQEALAQMERLEAQNPSFSPIPAQMAIIYQKLGDREKAVDKMYRALAISPENITYRYNLAIMLDTATKYEEAGRLYAQLLEARAKGEQIPGDETKIQQRLTFIRSNSPK